MEKRIDLDLFVRLMRLSSGARADLLEFIGETDISPQNLRAIMDQALWQEADTAAENHLQK